MIIKRGFTSETELKQTLDFIYDQSRQGKSFHGILEAAFDEITIVTAIHNIKSNKGAKTAGIDGAKIDKYLQMDKDELIRLIKKEVEDYRPKPVRRRYVKKSNGKLRPLGIPTIIERIIGECLRIILEPIVEARFYPQSYGFRPYRTTKHAIVEAVRLINCKWPQSKPTIAIEGDITGFFDNIDHGILIRKLWKIGVHDKRVISIIKKMLEAGYMENDTTFETETGAVQGGIISPLLANVYLNDFDWTVGRKYHHPKGQSREDNTRAKLKKQGALPKYLIRYCDDWIILTTGQPEAERFLGYLKKYFKQRLRLELSEEKTVITDLKQNSAKFLGFRILAGYPRVAPGTSGTVNIVGKSFPDMQKVKRKVKSITLEIKALVKMHDVRDRAIHIERINSKITGLAEYYKTSICKKTFRYIDYNVNRSAFAAFRKMYGNGYKTRKIPLCKLTNRPGRHKGYTSKTFAVGHDNMEIGITLASVTRSQWEKYPFNQAMTPYTLKGRGLYVGKSKRQKTPLDRPPLYDVETLQNNKYSKFNNFEYYMNREYAYNRDKGKCKICGKHLLKGDRHCHRIREDLPMNQINKVPNLAWFCIDCHNYVHETMQPEAAGRKIIKKVEKYRTKLKTI